VFSVDDLDGQRLHATWSRSGKRLIVSVAGPLYDPYAQVALDPDQAEALARSLAVSPGSAVIRFDDADDEGELQASWNPTGSRLTVAAAPVRRRFGGSRDDGREDVVAMQLRPREVEALARFLTDSSRLVRGSAPRG
jgi:hypothetical protein